MRKANVGRHLWVGINGQELDSATRRFLTEIQPGGIVLFSRNVSSSAQLKALTKELLSCLPIPPLIAIDQECQRVNRLREIVGELPTMGEVRQSGRAKELGADIGRVLKEHGIGADFAPVLDLELSDGQVDNALRDRCWGRTAQEVSERAGSFIEGLNGVGVLACGKHFPGLGASHQDSHEFLPTITRSRENLLGEDVEPYRQLKDRLDAVMVSHGHYVAFDGETPKPATLSRTVIGEVLRRQVGYDGVVVTDDMEMGAISRFGSFPEAVVESMAAGVDMVLICHTVEKILAAQEAIMKALETGKLKTGEMAASAARVEALRNRRT